MKPDIRHGIFLAILAAGLYALNSPFSKLLLRFMPSTLMAGFLYIGAGLGMIMIFIFRRIAGRPGNEAPLTGKELPYVIDPRRPGDIATCYSDPSKAKEVLGWSAEKNLQDMCIDAWRWQSQNPDGYVEK